MYAPNAPAHSGAPNPRQQALGVLARAPAVDLAERLARLGPPPAHAWLRRPETGMVMLRARIGGNGARFNLGETTVTRCALRLSDGQVGIGTVRGRDKRQAEHIALCDALLQHPAHAEAARALVASLAEDERRRHARRAADVAASKVDFFTLVRGDD